MLVSILISLSGNFEQRNNHVNIGLLTCIRASRFWLRQAVEKQKLLHPHREIIMSKLRVLAPLAKIPLVLSKDIRFFLGSWPHPNSKAGAVFNEICASGISSSMIWIPGPSQNYTITSFLRLLYRLPFALIFLFIIKRRVPFLDCIDLQIMLGREVFRQLLHRYPMVKPIIISDVSPDLHMLWSAATVAGCGALWWQDDYHHIQTLPYPVIAAAVLNQGGYEAVLNSSPSAVIVHRPSIHLKPIRPIPDYPRVGIATNNLFVASKEQRDLLEEIRKALGVKVVYIRLHPNSKLGSVVFSDTSITIAPFDESLEQFASKIDIAIVGNSAVQLKLVCEGLPVLHISGLDPLGFDLYGYCQMGITYGTQNLDNNILSDITTFVNDPELQIRLADYVSLRADVGLAGLSKLIIS